MATADYQKDCLAAWLERLEKRNREAIVLGLERVQETRQRLRLDPDFPVLTVGGTNGKGSTSAYLEAVLLAAGYRVGCYTSPHLLRYNERVRIAGVEASDTDLCAALAVVEKARGAVPLTYFEQGTLAAMQLFHAAHVDVAVLEVGMGGRLDAVNAWDADCAVVTSVDLDHQQFLGDTREAIGREKAGIFRPGRPAVCGDPVPPAGLLDHAEAINARLFRLGREIHTEIGESHWRCRVADRVYEALPRLAMPGLHQYGNAACAVAALATQRAPAGDNGRASGRSGPRPSAGALPGRRATTIAHPGRGPQPPCSPCAGCQSGGFAADGACVRGVRPACRQGLGGRSRCPAVAHRPLVRGRAGWAPRHDRDGAGGTVD